MFVLQPFLKSRLGGIEPRPQQRLVDETSRTRRRLCYAHRPVARLQDQLCLRAGLRLRPGPWWTQTLRPVHAHGRGGPSHDRAGALLSRDPDAPPARAQRCPPPVGGQSSALSGGSAAVRGASGSGHQRRGFCFEEAGSEHTHHQAVLPPLEGEVVGLEPTNFRLPLKLAGGCFGWAGGGWCAPPSKREGWWEKTPLRGERGKARVRTQHNALLPKRTRRGS